MRRLAAVSMLLCSACTSTTMVEPMFLVSPYMAVYRMRGDVEVQSGSPPANNPPQDMNQFGQGDHSEDFGIRADIGDGFGGARFDYYRLEKGTSESGTLTSDWGDLQAGDFVTMDIDMEEFRLGYLEPLARIEATWRDHPVTFRVAAGAVLAHRDIKLRARTTDFSRNQNVEIEGDVVCPAARVRIGWREVAFDVDYAISPDLALGGDFEGVQQDLEVRISYTLQYRDVTFFGGYRYSEFPAEGTTGAYRYDSDLRLDGFNVGVTVTF
jgi:hypothetical protein